MKTVAEVLKLSTEYLQSHRITHPRREAEELLSGMLDLSRISLYMQFDRPLMEEELVRYRACIRRRISGEPYQYILGQVDFMECTIKVSPDVLIPRQETEILAHKIVQFLSGKEELRGKQLWDICCGSGCLGISLKRALPQLSITLSDLSPAALAVARGNAIHNEAGVAFLEGDLCAPFRGLQADFIVCNPPYVAEQEWDSLDVEVKKFEPRIALLGGKQGTEFYERLALELPAVLAPGGIVWLEIGATQGPALLKIFSCSPWKEQILEKDWAGHDRFFQVTFKPQQSA